MEVSNFVVLKGTTQPQTATRAFCFLRQTKAEASVALLCHVASLAVRGLKESGTLAITQKGALDHLKPNIPDVLLTVCEGSNSPLTPFLLESTIQMHSG